MKRKNVFVLFSIMTFVFFQYSYGQNSIDEIINDIALPHEGKPHGVPSSTGWDTYPRIGSVQPPENWTSMTAWGQLYEWEGGNPAINTRVQLKDMEAYYLSKSDNHWHVMQKSVTVYGAAYVEDFANDAHKAADIRLEADSSISVTAGGGYNFHFWPPTRAAIPVNDIAGCFITVIARLILNDAGGADDRLIARYVLGVGGDWWETPTAQWDYWKTNREIGIGRFKYVTTEWKSFNLITLSEQAVRSNPPPCLCEGQTTINNEASDGNKRNTSMGAFELHQNFPNPFNHRTVIRYTLYKPVDVTMSIHDLKGRNIAILDNINESVGDHEIFWDTSELSSGLYLCKLQAGQFTKTIKIIVQK